MIGRRGGAEWVPTTAAELDDYVEGMRPRLSVNAQTREFIDFLIDYVEGYLRVQERATFERHLATSPHCFPYLQRYDQTIHLGKAACTDPDTPVPADVPEELVQAILASRRLRS